jgi:hypothetical protein
VAQLPCDDVCMVALHGLPFHFSSTSSCAMEGQTKSFLGDLTSMCNLDEFKKLLQPCLMIMAKMTLKCVEGMHDAKLGFFLFSPAFKDDFLFCCLPFWQINLLSVCR